MIEPSLLATRADIEALIRGDDDARLASGWRSEMVGEPLRRLVAGEAALAFDHGKLVLEERSRRPVAAGGPEAPARYNRNPAKSSNRELGP